MALYARLLTPTDYDTILVQWWSDWGWKISIVRFLYFCHNFGFDFVLYNFLTSSSKPWTFASTCQST